MEIYQLKYACHLHPVTFTTTRLNINSTFNSHNLLPSNTGVNVQYDASQKVGTPSICHCIGLNAAWDCHQGKYVDLLTPLYVLNVDTYSTRVKNINDRLYGLKHALHKPWC